jgi:hypothetical protein
MPSERKIVTGPVPALWFTRRAASASVPRGLAFVPKFESTPLDGLK